MLKSDEKIFLILVLNGAVSDTLSLSQIEFVLNNANIFFFFLNFLYNKRDH